VEDRGRRILVASHFPVLTAEVCLNGVFRNRTEQRTRGGHGVGRSVDVFSANAHDFSQTASRPSRSKSRWMQGHRASPDRGRRTREPHTMRRPHACQRCDRVKMALSSELVDAILVLAIAWQAYCPARTGSRGAPRRRLDQTEAGGHPSRAGTDVHFLASRRPNGREDLASAPVRCGLGPLLSARSLRAHPLARSSCSLCWP
jgi:hypothetical protein